MYLYTVEHLVALFESSEDGYSVLNGRLIDHNRLETSFKRRILLDVLTVLVECSSTDTVEFAPCKHRLKKVAGIHSAVRLTCADYSVKLIDKEKYLTIAVLYLVKHSFKTLLEFAPVLCTCHKCTHIQREHFAVLKTVGDISCNDTKCKSLSDSSFSDTGFTDKDRVVLCFTREYADNVSYLAVTSDNGIQLISSCKSHKLLTVLGKHIVGILGVLACDTGISSYGHKCAEEAVPCDVECPEKRSNVIVLAVDKRKHDMFNGNELVLHIACDILCGGKNSVTLCGYTYIAASAAACDLRQSAYLLIHLALEDIRINVHPSEKLWDKTIFLFKKSCKKMHRLYHVIGLHNSNTLCLSYSVYGLLSVFLCIHIISLL